MSLFISGEPGSPSSSFTGSGWERLDVNSLSRASSRRGLGQGRLISNMPGPELSGFSLEGLGVNVRVETGGAGSAMRVGTGLLLVIPGSGFGLLARTPGKGLLVALTAVIGLGLFLTTTGLEVLAIVTGLELFTSTIRFELFITSGGLGLLATGLEILRFISGEEAFTTTGGLFSETKIGLEVFRLKILGELTSSLFKLDGGRLEVFADGSGDKRDSGTGLFALETTGSLSEWFLEEVKRTVELDTGALVVDSSTMCSSSRNDAQLEEGKLWSDTSASGTGTEGTVRLSVTIRLGSSDPSVDNESSLTDTEPD